MVKFAGVNTIHYSRQRNERTKHSALTLRVQYLNTFTHVGHDSKTLTRGFWQRKTDETESPHRTRARIGKSKCTKRFWQWAFLLLGYIGVLLFAFSCLCFRCCHFYRLTHLPGIGIAIAFFYDSVFRTLVASHYIKTSERNFFPFRPIYSIMVFTMCFLY